MDNHFLDEIPVNDLPRLIFRYKEYTAAFHLYKLVLNPELKATLEEQTKAKEMVEALKTRLSHLKQEIRDKIGELLNPLSQPNPSTTPDGMKKELEMIHDILQGHDDILQALQAQARAPAPHIINNTVNCGGHGQPTVAPVPVAPVPTAPGAPTAPGTPKVPGRVNIDLSDSTQLKEIIRKALDDIDTLPLRLSEMGIPSTYHIAILTAMVEKTIQLRALVQPST